LEQKIAQLENSLEAKGKNDNDGDTLTDVEASNKKRRDSMVVNAGGKEGANRKKNKSSNKVRRYNWNENHTYLYSRK
jgi:hypothetical protein